MVARGCAAGRGCLHGCADRVVEPIDRSGRGVVRRAGRLVGRDACELGDRRYDGSVVRTWLDLAVPPRPRAGDRGSRILDITATPRKGRRFDRVAFGNRIRFLSCSASDVSCCFTRSRISAPAVPQARRASNSKGSTGSRTATVTGAGMTNTLTPGFTQHATARAVVGMIGRRLQVAVCCPPDPGCQTDVLPLASTRHQPRRSCGGWCARLVHIHG